MRYLKTFEQYQINEMWWNPFTWGKKKKEPLKLPQDFSNLHVDDTKFIEYGDFIPSEEVREIVRRKIEILEKDPKFHDILEIIRYGEFIDAKSMRTQNFFKLPKSCEIKLEEDRILKVFPMKTLELGNGDFDVHYCMTINDKPGGYISYENFENILKTVEEFEKNK
jgi:hypothetical protein